MEVLIVHVKNVGWFIRLTGNVGAIAFGTPYPTREAAMRAAQERFPNAEFRFSEEG